MDDQKDDQQSSTWREYLGVASADRAIDSPELTVIVPELMPALQGNIAHATTTNNINLTDISGNPIQSTATTTNSITAIWYGESNRRFPPDIRKGEQVRVLKYGTSDRYYWKALGRDSNLRKLETLRFEVSDDNSANKPLTDDNTYYLELDTLKQKRIILRTSKTNGEAHIYQILIDTKNSKIQICDDVNNEILIESETPRVRMRNKSGSFLDLNDVDFILAAPRDGMIRADRQLLFVSPQLTANITNVISLATNSYTLKASSSAITTSSTIGLNGSSKITGALVSGPVRAPSYSTGAVGSGYSPSTTDISKGFASIVSNAPDTAVGANQRHAAAYEQINSALAIIQEALNEINIKTGAPTNNYTTLTTLGQQSEMPDNQGD